MLIGLRAETGLVRPIRVGNDNGLCESDETCLFMPNIGSYQGHGALVSAGAFTDGELIGITLMRYEINGR